jgi:hypothetical protein
MSSHRPGTFSYSSTAGFEQGREHLQKLALIVIDFGQIPL